MADRNLCNLIVVAIGMSGRRVIGYGIDTELEVRTESRVERKTP